MSRKDKYEVIDLKENNKKDTVDKNFFKAVSYDMAGEIGKIDNEDMQKNKYINSDGEVIEDKTRSHKNKPR